MDIEITLKNYRCFSDTSPACFVMRKGFTAFVGVNNAGKSSLLKFFVEFRQLFRALAGSPAQVAIALNKGQDFPFQQVKDPTGIFCKENNRDLSVEIVFRNVKPPRETSEIPKLNKMLITVSRKYHKWTVKLFAEGQQLDFPEGNPNPSEWRLARKDPSDLDLDISNLQDLNLLANAFYIGPFRNAINMGESNNYYDIQVGQAFIRMWGTNKTGNLISLNEAMLRLTEDIRRIFGFSNLEINSADDDTDFKVYLNGKSYTLLELGGGLAQFIIVLGNAATRQPSFILIDEPELNLHPRLQLDFLTTLGSYAQEGILFATHNIGLARASAQQIYSVRVRDDKEHDVRPLEGTPRLSEFLGEMSFSGYRELGYRKLLLVEGASDVLTIQQFLRIYGKEHEIVILPLGGGEMIKEGIEPQLEEIKRITNNIIALIDSERNKPDAHLNKNIQGFVDACSRTVIDCHVLRYRAIENYLSERAIQIVFGPKYSALKPYELLKGVEFGWGKADNWKIARVMEKWELEQTDLGEFLDKL
jgi:ABC-type cobalamin/Fe3+-siderophores transport system ATPase subunit